MAVFSPHYNLYKIIKRISFISQIIFWLILVFSITPVVFNTQLKSFGIENIINILNIITISIFFIITLISEYILLPIADSDRRDDFIDNSFGSAFSPENSIEYYDNEEIQLGIYKVAVNLFENCFFTFSLVKITTMKKIIWPSIILTSIIIFAYYGFKETPLAVSVLQALFSVNILGDLIKHLILYNRLKTIQDSFISLFQNEDLKTNITKYQASIYRYWLQYETWHSKINAGIPEKVFKKHNPTLTEKWQATKIKYRIN